MLDTFFQRDSLSEERRAAVGHAACRDELGLIGERKVGSKVRVALDINPP